MYFKFNFGKQALYEAMYLGYHLSELKIINKWIVVAIACRF